MIEPISKALTKNSGAIYFIYINFIKQIGADFSHVNCIVAAFFVKKFFPERENNFQKYFISAGNYLFPGSVSSVDSVSERQFACRAQSRFTEKRHYKNQTSSAYLGIGI